MSRVKAIVLPPCVLAGLLVVQGEARLSRAEDDPKAALRADAKLLADALAKLPPDGTLDRVSSLLSLGTLQRVLGDPESAPRDLEAWA
jgi:hypothetical protein